MIVPRPRAICPCCWLIRPVRRYTWAMASHRYVYDNGYSRGSHCAGVNQVPDVYVMTTNLTIGELRTSDRVMLRRRKEIR
jgi:hypothetical protein